MLHSARHLVQHWGASMELLIMSGRLMRLLALALLIGLALGAGLGLAVHALWLDSPSKGVPTVLH
jgi:hypothetical protein